MKILRSDNIALVHEQEDNVREFSYSDLINYIDGYRDLLNVKQGSKIGILMENRPEWLFTFFAILDSRCVAVPLDHMASDTDLEYTVADSDVDMIFCSNKTFKSNLKLKMVNVDELKLEVKKENYPVKDFNNHIEDLAVIIYTSGTSGKPLGVMLTKSNIFSNLNDLLKIVNWPINDVIYTFAPLFHSAGLISMCFLSPSYSLKIILSDKLSSDHIIHILQKYKVNIFGIVPKFAYILHKKLMDKINSNFFTRSLFKISKFFQNPTLSKILFKKIYRTFGGSLKYIACGGSGLDKGVQEDLAALSLNIYMSYGMTEASPIISYSVEGQNKYGASGRVLPSIDLKIVDGEIVVKGPNIFQGYYKNRDKTDEVLKDGYLSTGDLGYLDQDGYLYITGRKKEIIVLSNGKNVWPQKIEDEIQSISNIFEEVAIFEDSDSLKAIVKVNIEFAKEEKISNLLTYVKDKVADYNIKVPDYLKVRDISLTNEPLPRTRLGKLKRHLLKELQIKKSIKKEIVDNFEYNQIEDFFLQNFDTQISMNSHIEMDSSLDSLGKIELINFIERTFSIKISLEDLSERPIIKDLVEFISEQSKKVSNLKNIIIKKVERRTQKNYMMKLFDLICKVYFKLDVKGIENIQDKPSILVANHLSILDWYAIHAALGDRGEQTFCLAKDKLIKKGFLKWISNRSNLIVFNIDKNVGDALEEMKSTLKSGKSVLIFPEGTRSRTGELLPFKKSFAMIAKAVGVEITPIRIDGTLELLPPGKILPKPGKVSVKFGTPISSETSIEEIIKKAEDSILEMK